MRYPFDMDELTDHKPASTTASVASNAGWAGAIALVGFILVATTQVSNMILARGLAGSVPPFALAFFRWSIIFLGLAPLALKEIQQGRIPLVKDAWPILAAGFLGMFLCGGPVYVAGISTTAIHIALIMALSPIVVLLISAALSMEHIGRLQWFGTALALAGALVIVTGGHPEALMQSNAAWVICSWCSRCSAGPATRCCRSARRRAPRRWPASACSPRPARCGRCRWRRSRRGTARRRC